MTDLVPVTKTCATCGEAKPGSEFYVESSTRPDRLRNECKDCTTDRTRTWIASERDRMGEEAWKAHRADIVRRSRQNPAVRERGRQSVRARAAALEQLRQRHADEFAALLRIERHERGLE